jgi:hypothetical protein
VSCKVIDSFLDPAYNKTLGREFYTDAVLKNKLGNLAYETLTDDILERFWDLRELTFEEFKSLASEIISMIANHNEELSSKMLAADFAQASDHIQSKHASHDPNTTSFYSLISQLQMQLEARGVDSWSIYHDETQTFESKLSEIKKIFTDAEMHAIKLNNGATMRFGSENLDTLSFVKSKDMPLVRLCDYYVGSINHLIKKALVNDEEYFKSNGEHLLIYLAQMIVKIPGTEGLYQYVISDRLHRQIAQNTARNLRL